LFDQPTILARDSIACYSALYAIARPSVRLSHGWYQNDRSWMTLNCCKFKFSRNFALVGMFGRQQRLNE